MGEKGSPKLTCLRIESEEKLCREGLGNDKDKITWEASYSFQFTCFVSSSGRGMLEY